MALLLLLQAPIVQTRLAQYLSRVLSAKTGFNISVNEVNIEWLDRFKIEGLNITDEDNVELLSLSSLEVNYKLASVFKETINLDKAVIEGMVMRLHKEDDDTLNITILINRIKELIKPKKNKLSAALIIDEVRISKSSFYYAKGNQIQTKKRFNPNYFSLVNIDGYLQSLVVISDTFKVEVVSLQLEERTTGLRLYDLKTNYLISPREMRFDSLYTHLGNTEINKSIVFSYNGYDDLSAFTDSVNIEANLDMAIIDSEDLSHFSSYFENINDRYIISGLFKGEVSDFRIKNLALKLGKGTHLNGSVYFSGLPDINETFINIRLKNSNIFEHDVAQYIPSNAFNAYNRFKQVQLNGSFTGYIEDFVAYGKFNTDFGSIVTDINLKIAANPANTSYSGEIQLDNFDLGRYLEKKKLGKITLNGKLTGNGIQMSNANFSFDGSIDSLALYGYTYSNIQTMGEFKQEYFSGSLDIDDPNLILHTKSVIDLRNRTNKIIINGELEYAQLTNLKLVENHALVKSKIEANIQGFAIDSIIGNIYLENFYAEHEDQKLPIEHLTLNSENKNGLRSLELISDKANLKLWGDFNYTTAYRDLKFMAREYFLSLQNNKDSLLKFYSTPSLESLEDQYKITLKARFKNIDKFIKLFQPTLSLHNSTTIDIQYRHGNTSNLALQFLNDTISYKGNTFINNNINLDASKLFGKPDILAAADIQSEEQYLNNGGKLDNLIVSAVWDNKKIDFNWYHTQQKLKNTNDLYGEVFFYKDSTQIHLNKSNLFLLDKIWTIQDNNYITLANQTINIQNLNIYSEDQMISVTGEVARDPDKILSITANNLDLAIINPLISKELSGQLSGEFALSNVYNTPTIVSNFYINGFAINQLLVGNIYSSNDWNNDQKLFDIQFIVNRDDTPVILVNGIFNPFDKNNALDLNASFMSARLDMAEPFIDKLFSDLEGSITGNIHIIGSLRSPKISGEGSINNARLKVNYLNTNYAVTGQWAFDSTAIYLKELLLVDAKNNNATLDGRFTHHSFKNFNINLKGEMDKFMVLNTNATNNDLFYGTGIATGNVSFTGPIEDITIKAQATTERGTKFYIPIGGSSSTEMEEFISFVDFSDTLNKFNINKDQEIKVTGLNLEFDLDITEAAYAEIIFDITSGDIIRGRGTGHLSMKIDTKGEFNMLGTFEFVSGGYNFTMYNIVNKEFIINPKSSISWSGDPYGGIMDIDASYKLVTSLAPLVDTIYHDTPDLKRLYPTEVRLGLDGPLLTPDIEFNIIIDEYPKSNVDLDTQIKGFLNTIAADQQELNRQVFSLLILRKFSYPNSFSSAGSIGSSVSEFVSNQLSYWISQVDENLTIDMDLDLGKLDEDALKTFQLRVSYAFMDGKLIVTRDGGFTDPNNEASLGSIAGDWTLEYLLSEDGKLRVKLFNKTNYNQFNSSTGSASQALISAGFSLIYTTSFNSLSDLFQGSNKSKDKKRINTEPTTSGIKPDEIQYEVPH